MQQQNQKQIVVYCPHCGQQVEFKKKSTGRWFGSVIGGGAGAWIGSSLGIAGTFLTIPIAIAATPVVLGAGALFGWSIGKKRDNKKVKCPSCNKGIILG